jgi:hypothetical protein
MSRGSLALLGAVALTAAATGATAAGAAPATKLRATLSGANEIPSGDADGRGTFRASFRRGRLCYTLTYARIGMPVAAHIHRGTARQNGDIVVDLLPRFRRGEASRCVRVAPGLRRAIRTNPSRFYVNVHTQALAGGAIRGQLRRAR